MPTDVPRPARGFNDTRAIFDIDEPVFLLNAPFSLDTRVANNATMEALGEHGRMVDRQRALAQWRLLYRHLASRSLVYLLPSRAGLQDQPCVANLAVAFDFGEEPVVILSRFRAPGREHEAAFGLDFFADMGIATQSCPDYFEGEADLKRLGGRVYFGGFGSRSSRAAHHWLHDSHGLTIVALPLEDPHLFHLDCILHVVSSNRVLLATAACTSETVRQVEAYAEIVDVPLDLAYRGATNVVRVGGEILCDSCLDGLDRSDPLYAVEKRKQEFWQRLAPSLGVSPSFFDMSEFYKSGAMLSCLVLPLNYPHLQA